MCSVDVSFVPAVTSLLCYIPLSIVPGYGLTLSKVCFQGM